MRPLAIKIIKNFCKFNEKMEIDIFSGDLEELAYLEIEFVDTESVEKYENPDWVIKDVTTDLSYKNGYLARYGIPKSYFEYIK